MPGVTFQEPTDLLGEGDSLHLARAGRRPQGKAGQGTRGLLRRRRQAEGRRVAPEAPVPRLSPGAQQQGGSAGRALRKRRAQRAAARGTLGAGARKGLRPDWGSTQGQRRGPLRPAPKDYLDFKETAVLEETSKHWPWGGRFKSP